MYRTVGEVKAYGAQMLHQSETEKSLAGDTAESRQDLIERWLTKSWDRIARFHNWDWLQESRTFTWPTTTSNVGAVLYLPDYVWRLYSVYEENQNHPVRLMEKRVFDKARPGSPVNRGQDVLIQYGEYGVEADVGTEGAVTATSDAGASDENLTVHLEGLTGSGATARTLRETLTLNASGTATSSGSFASGQGGLRRATIGSVPTGGGGLITITDAGGTTLERLDAANERAHEHIRTELFPYSGGTTTFNTSFYRRSFNVTADNDTIDMPHEFHHIMEDGIMIELNKFLGNWDVAMTLERERFANLKELVGWTNKQPGLRRVLSAEPQWGSRRWRRWQ